MYVSNLFIKNYRNFMNFSIDLKPFTLIIGENNKGKTNLLNALCLLFSQDITFFSRRILEYEDINFQAVYEFKKNVIDNKKEYSGINFPEVLIQVLLEDFTPDQEAVVGDWFIDKNLSKAKLTYLFRIKGTFDKNKWMQQQREKVTVMQKDVSETEEAFQQRKIDNIDFPIKDYEYLVFGGDDSSRRTDFHFLGMLRMEFLDALRDTRRELMASRDYRLLYRILNNRDISNFAVIKESLIHLQNLIKDNPELQRIKKDIQNYLAKISLYEKEAENTVEFQFSCPECSEILKKISLVYGENPINVERNGLGRNNLLYISLVLSHLTGHDDVPVNDDVFFRLIGIEEPESHLHPHLQDHLAKNIKSEVEGNKNIQVIITSHSTHIAGKLDVNNTAILYQDDNEIKSHYILGGFGPSADEQRTIRYLKKYLDATNSAMFFARKVILVEGISEQLLIPKLFLRLKGKTLEQIGCNIVNVSGVSFRHFLEIIRHGYFIKCVVLTDDDADTKIENRADNLQKEFGECSLISIKSTLRSTFEKDIIESNKAGSKKETLLNALKATRPQKEQEYEGRLKGGNLDIQEFFDLIKDYKSEFAFNLSEILNDKKCVFKTPLYIREGFNFIFGKNELSE